MPLGESQRLTKWDRVMVASFGGLGAARPAVAVDRRPFAGYWEYLLDDAIFTSPPHPAFGGAALIGADGTLLGVGSLIVGDALTGERVLPGNMFVPIDRLKAVLGDLLTLGRSSEPARPWLGVYTEEVQGRLAVRRLAADGPALKAGIEVGDLILGVANQPVETMADFYRRVWDQGSAGAPVRLNVLKGTELSEVTIRSEDRYDWLRMNPSY